MIAVQVLEKRTAELKHTKARLAAMAERLQALELRNNHSVQIASEKSLGDNLRQNENLTIEERSQASSWDTPSLR
jgi:hypothetical protein